MRKIHRLIAAVACGISWSLLPLLVGAQTPPRPQPANVAPAKPYIDETLASQTAAMEDKIKRDFASAVGQPAEPFRREAQASLARGDGRRALSFARNAVAADSSDWLNWVALARSAQAITEFKDYSERYQLQELGTTGAYAAFQKAKTPVDQAAALAVLGAAYQKSEYWRQSLRVYRASLALADQPAVRRTYETLREKYGFQIKDYKVDSDAAAPRACFEFSESLKRDRADFSSFVAVTGNQGGTSVSVEDTQLCVEGLKHGERYGIVLRQGLPSDVGEDLLKSADYAIYVRDRSPAVRFTGKNYVLPKTGQQGLPVVTVNTPSVELSIFRIGDRSLLPTVRSEDFLEQLSGSTAATIASEKGQKVWSGTLDTRNDLNQDVVTAFPIAEAVKDMLPGVYVMFAKPPGPATPDGEEDYATRATQWFVVSDLGLTAFTGDDGVHVLVRSLATAAPMAGIDLRLVAKNNEVLGSLKTDANGYARFDPGLARGQDGMAPALVTASDGKADHGFLDLQQTAFDLTDRGVKGRAAPGPLDAFLYTERGVYRSGETVYVTALLRDAAGNAVAGIPLTAVIARPDGVEYRRQVVADQGLGGRSISVPLLSGAQTGTWHVSVYSDPKRAAIGSTSFLVEDYVPERLEITLKTVEPYVRPGQPVTIDTTARYLYGAVGSDLDVTGDYRIEASDDTGIPALKDYQVGLGDETFDIVTGELENSATTDAQGKARLSVPLQQTSSTRPLKATIGVHVSESGGRAISRLVSVPIAPAGSLIGVKPLFEDGTLTEGSKAEFDAVLVGNDGKRMARNGVRWVLNRVDHRYQWFYRDGRWNFDSSKTTRAIANGTIDMSEGVPARISQIVKLGSYRLDLSAEGLQGAETSVNFSVGWAGEQTANTPDVLDMTLDKKAYAAGDTMKLKISPRFGVKATLAIVSDKLHEMTLVDVPAAGDTVSLPVKAEWGAGAYVVALAHRPLDAQAQRAPGRAIGIAWFGIERSAKVLQVELDTPKTIAPRGKLTIPVKLNGLKEGQEAYVAVAAVDVGILNLTRYQPPEPSTYFFGQRQLGLELRDLYGFLIDGLQGTRGQIRSGGDGGAPGTEGPPPIFEPLARYSGVTRVGADGTARIEFDVPAFNGTVRIMATAWSAGQVGEGRSDVIIRDPIVVQGTLPRFLNVGDQSRFHIALDNVEGPAGDYVVDIDAHGPVSVPADALRSTLKLAKGQKASLTLPVTAAGLGTASFDLRLKGQGIDVGQSLTLRIQPSTSAQLRRSVRQVPAGGSLNLTSDLLADMLPGSGTVSVSISPLASLDVPALLKQLDRYPYGCTEQTVSRAMPLLYVNRLEAQERFNLDQQADERIRTALERVLNRQSSNGSFGLWSVGGEDLWLNAFVGDFLTRAREQNFAVPQKAYDLALDQLRNTLVNASDVKPETAAGLAYAAYVLARNGRPVMGDLRYLVDTKLDEFGTALARAQLGAALSLLGDKGRAATAFHSALDLIDRQRADELWRPDYGTKLRDGVATLALLAETGGARADIQRASLVVERARDAARWTSTQEQGWMVIAAQALSKDAEAIALTVDGKAQSGAFYRTFPQQRLEDAPMTIVNSGTNPIRAVVALSGVPLTPEPAIDQGYRIERSYYSMAGQPLDMGSVKQNTRFIVSLKVTERTSRTGRVLLVDPLPAGLEIDNPALVEGSVVPDAAWLKRDVEPASSEYRDDRFVAAFDRDATQPTTFAVAYVVRAVSPGHYVRPGASVEDMYRPERFGRTDTGVLDVTAAR